MPSKTLFDKVWDDHIVVDLQGGGTLLYIDRHLVHEVTSPQAFDGLREAGRPVRRPDLTFATVDHNVPTDGRPIDERTLAGRQLAALSRNAEEFGVPAPDPRLHRTRHSRICRRSRCHPLRITRRPPALHLSRLLHSGVQGRRESLDTHHARSRRTEERRGDSRRMHGRAYLDR